MTKEDAQDKLKKQPAAPQAQSARKTISKQRVRPTVRANESQKQRQQPLPAPPARRPLPATSTPPPAAARPASAPAAKPTGGVEPAARARQLQEEYGKLEAKAQMSQVYDSIGKIDKYLLEYPTRLEKLRAQGYAHGSTLEDTLESLDDKWNELRPRVETTLQAQVQRLDRELEQADRIVSRIQPTEQSLRLAEPIVKNLSGRIDAAITAVSGLYQGVESELNKVGWTVSKLETMLALIAESPHIRLLSGEGPLTAVKAMWQRDGDNKGPEGALVLTDQRLIFEQREEVVTKRKFGIFKAESEKIQQVHIDVQVSEIEQIEAKKEGGFLGMGKDDILGLVLAASAPVSRARFHLKGQDSAEWAALIKKAQTGEIDGERAAVYVDQLTALAATAFPTTCPNCYAAVQPPARGVTSVTCEFCGAVITPQSP